MTFAGYTDVALVLLCIAVLVQCARMRRSFNAIRSADLAQTVERLDRATAQSRSVLAELKQLLATDGAANARAIASGERLRDELSIMVDVGNSVAERISKAASTADRRTRDRAAASAPEPKSAAARRAPATARPKRAAKTTETK